jgi:hypothetical protein
MATSVTRLRPRFSRTFSRSRWAEYRGFLLSARDHKYTILPLEEWVLDPGAAPAPTLILRHDVDQHPRSALTMAAVEEELGVRSSWYFRWRTAHPAVVRSLRDRGFEIGLHYETLTRSALAGELDTSSREGSLARARGQLRAEIAAFERLFGPIRSAVPHGDSRVPEVDNSELLKGEDCSTYGIEFDGNEAMRGRGLGYWLTDRTAAEGRWNDAADPSELFAERVSPILSVTHPNNWASGPSLWTDRLLRGARPRPAWDSNRSRGPIHTGSDLPPG